MSLLYEIGGLTAKNVKSILINIEKTMTTLTKITNCTFILV